MQRFLLNLESGKISLVKARFIFNMVNNMLGFAFYYLTWPTNDRLMQT